jgi:hypothetical protein
MSVRVVHPCYIAGMSEPETYDTGSCMRAAIKAVVSGGDFTCFDLCFTAREKTTLDTVKVATSGNYDHFYFNDRYSSLALKTEVARFFVSTGTAPLNASRVARVVSRLTTEAISASGKEAGWITIRNSEPNHFDDTPRWHADGLFFASRIDRQYKIAMP